MCRPQGQRAWDGTRAHRPACTPRRTAGGRRGVGLHCSSLPGGPLSGRSGAPWSIHGCACVGRAGLKLASDQLSRETSNRAHKSIVSKNASKTIFTKTVVRIFDPALTPNYSTESQITTRFYVKNLTVLGTAFSGFTHNRIMGGHGSCPRHTGPVRMQHKTSCGCPTGLGATGWHTHVYSTHLGATRGRHWRATLSGAAGRACVRACEGGKVPPSSKQWQKQETQNRGGVPPHPPASQKLHVPWW